MKTLIDFKKFYSDELIVALRLMDLERKKSIGKLFRTIALFLLSIIVLLTVGLFVNNLVYHDYISNRTANIPLTIAFVISLSLFIMMFQAKRNIINEFNLLFKNRIISKILRFINDDLKYSPNEFLSQEIFNVSGIFKMVPNIYYGDDLVTGIIDKTEIAFSEVHAAFKSQSSRGDKAKRNKIFDGLFFTADFHKDFKGEYFILPDKAEKKFGKVGQFFQKFNKSRGQLVKLEDPEFEKEFVVYGSDQVEARYILSTSLMRKMLEFKKRTNKAISISFVISHICIAIPYSRELFEAKYFSSVIDEDKTIEYFSDLELAISIVEEFNLNTRIWNKE
jgi:hypothetical protein